MSETKRVLYVKEGCPYCVRMAEDLKKKGVDYSEVDVSRDGASLREIKNKYGATKVPVFVEGQQVTIGYQGNG